MSKQILYIDDDPPILMVAAQVLRKHGFDVTAASGNDEALAHLEQDPQAFDLVIQDCLRPLGRCLADVGPPDELYGASGQLFLRRHIWRLNPALPCLFITMDSLGFLLRADPGLEGNPLFHYLTKPFEIQEMIATVRNILAEQRGPNAQASGPGPEQQP